LHERGKRANDLENGPVRLSIRVARGHGPKCIEAAADGMAPQATPNIGLGYSAAPSITGVAATLQLVQDRLVDNAGLLRQADAMAQSTDASAVTMVQVWHGVRWGPTTCYL
jgi:hypothetical protein